LSFSSRIALRAKIQHDEWDFATANQQHGTAFLIGRIAEIVRSGQPGRWLIKISEYAEINIPNVWKGWRFPVRYMPLSDFGIDPTRLTFTRLLGANCSGVKPGVPVATAVNGVVPLSIAEAKRGLAVTFGISDKDIEITIRG
jgi:hypothetical protein